MNDYITPDSEHSALLIIDVQRDFTLIGSIAEIPGTLQAIQYIQQLVQVYRENKLSYNSYYKALSCRRV